MSSNEYKKSYYNFRKKSLYMQYTKFLAYIYLPGEQRLLIEERRCAVMVVLDYVYYNDRHLGL